MTLLDSQRQVALSEHAMLQQIRAQKGRAVSGGRVLAHAMRLEEEAHAQIILRVMRLAAEQIDQRRETLCHQRRIGIQIQHAAAQCIQAANGHDHGRNAGRHHLDGAGGVDVAGRNAQRVRHGLARTACARHHRRRNKPRGFVAFGGVFETDRNLSHRKIQPHQAGRHGRNVLADDPRRAQNRVPGKSNLARGRKQANAVAVVRIGQGFDESRFRIIRFQRNPLHGFGGQVVGMGHHRQRIARVGLLGKNIDDMKRVGHGCQAGESRCPVSAMFTENGRRSAARGWMPGPHSPDSGY